MLLKGCLRGNLTLVRLALLAGADINKKNSRGQTPLILAVSKSQKNVVAFLLSKDADVTIQAAFGNTVFHWCCNSYDRNLFSMLLAAGADPNKRNLRGKTPLHFAASLRNVTLIKFLTENNADLNAVDKYEQTPFSRLLRNTKSMDKIPMRCLHMLKTSKILKTPKKLPQTNSISLDYSINPENPSIRDYLTGHCSEIETKIMIEKNKLQDLEIVRNHKELKILSGLFNLKIEKIQLNHQLFSLRGGMPIWPAKVFSKAFENFIENREDQLSIQKNKASQIIEALDAAFDGNEDVQNKDLILIPAGWTKHTVGVGFYKNYMAICNRGKGASEKGTVKVFKIDRKLVTLGTIGELRRECNWKKTYKEGMKFYYEDLVRKVSPNQQPKQDTLCKAFEKKHLKWQTWGNCSFASKKAEIYFSYVMSLFERDADFNDPKMIAEHLTQGRKEYKAFSDYIGNMYLQQIEEKGLSLVDPADAKKIFDAAHEHNRKKITRNMPKPTLLTNIICYFLRSRFRKYE